MAPDAAPAAPPPALLAHATRNALAIAFGRVQLLRRAAQRADLDPDRLAANLEEIDGCLRRVAGLIDALEAQARPLARPDVAAAED